MHRLFLLPELLLHIVSFLPATDIPPTLLLSSSISHTIRANLPAHRLPLPDPPYPAHQVPSRPLPAPIHRLATQIHLHSENWICKSHAIGLGVGDDYFFWHTGALDNLLGAVKPLLHPLLAEYAVALVAGVETLAAGQAAFIIRTEVPGQVLADVLGEEGDARMVCGVGCRSVEVWCVKGGRWDAEYGNVVGREGMGRCLRVERAKGVRLRDVCDEARGVLVPDGEEIVVLEWQFGGLGMRK